MSGVFEEAMRLESLGLNTVPHKNLCAGHIEEDIIKKFIRKGSSPGYCDYCKKNKLVIPLEDLMEFLVEAVARFYTDPVEFMSYNSAEGGYLGTIYETKEILEEIFELDIPEIALYNDIYESLDVSKIWADENMYYDMPSDIMLYSWNYFKKAVKHRSRYFFGLIKNLQSDQYLLDSNQVLAEIGSTVKKFKLLKVLPKGTALYRCRQHEKNDSSVLTAAGMASPPTKYALNPNRMSPAGISMFYGAFEIETSLKETIDFGDISKNYFTTVKFLLNRDLNILDLSSIPILPSPFDPKRNKDRFSIIFLKNFIKDLTAPIKRDGGVHVEYVPTQLITEYFRFPFSERIRDSKKIDGIIYPSSRNSKRACVLFFDNEESIKELDMDISSLETMKVQQLAV